LRDGRGRAPLDLPSADANTETRPSTVRHSDADGARATTFSDPPILAEGFDVAHVYEEIETGSGADALSRRPQLAAALKAARKMTLAWHK